jgi:hypothetical protein
MIIEGWAVWRTHDALESGLCMLPVWLMYSKWNLRSVTSTISRLQCARAGREAEHRRDLLTRQTFQTKRERRKNGRVQLSSVQLTSYFGGYSGNHGLARTKAQENKR